MGVAHDHGARLLIEVNAQIEARIDTIQLGEHGDVGQSVDFAHQG